MEPVQNFMRRFTSSLKLDKKTLVKSQSRYFLIEDEVRRFVQGGFYYAGTYLGKAKGGIFFPSFFLLAMMAKRKANKVIVDDRTAWLFICGRDIFRQGILRAEGGKEKGDYALVLNQRGECLGFGRVLNRIDATRDERRVTVKNISDIGDFLRREK